MRRAAGRIAALIGKELTQIRRDRRAVGMMIGLPLIQIFLYAYAIHLTVEHLPTAVADMSHDSESRSYLAALAQSGYFDIKAYVDSQAGIIHAIDAGSAKVGVVIGPGFAADAARGKGQVLILLDGSDSLSVNSGYSAAVAVAQNQALDLAAAQARRRGIDLQITPIVTATRVLYNPNLNDLIFIMPGLVAVLLQIMSMFATSTSVVREHELGSIEQLLATPARPLELMIGKLVANMVLMLAVLVLVNLIGVFWFGVPFRGSAWLYAWLSLLFVFSALGLGLLTSAISRTQQEAQQISTMATMFCMMLSGFVFPRGPMPPLVRLVGDLIPLTYYIRIARGIVTKGVGVAFMWSDVVALAVYVVLVMGLAALTTKKRLD